MATEIYIVYRKEEWEPADDIAWFLKREDAERCVEFTRERQREYYKSFGMSEDSIESSLDEYGVYSVVPCVSFDEWLEIRGHKHEQRTDAVR